MFASSHSHHWTNPGCLAARWWEKPAIAVLGLSRGAHDRLGYTERPLAALKRKALQDWYELLRLKRRGQCYRPTLKGLCHLSLSFYLFQVPTGDLSVFCYDEISQKPFCGIKNSVGLSWYLNCRKLWLVLDSFKRRSVMVHPKVPTDTFMCNRFLNARVHACTDGS